MEEQGRVAMIRVVIIEPDARRREIKETQLKAAGYHVIGVADEDLARAVARVSPYPLLMLRPDDAFPLPFDARPLNRHRDVELIPASPVR
jgi:hypothetical protein